MRHFAGPRRLHAAIGVLSLALCGVAAAQSPKPTTPPPPAAAAKPAPTPVSPAAPAAPAAAPSASQLAAAKQLIVVSGLSRSFSIVVPQFMDQIGTTLTQTRPELIRDLNTVMEQLKPEFDQQSNEMIDAGAQIYAKLMTEAEIRSAVTFFTSDAGRKYVEVQPLFLNDIVPAMQSWQQRIAANMMTRVRTEMQKKGHSL